MYAKHHQAAITRAMNVIAEHYQLNDLDTLSSPRASVQYLKCYLNRKEEDDPREHFAVVFLNSQHKVIECETLFSGTIDGAAVYPREVARRSLELGAAAVIFGHNHPSGNPEPSNADRRITKRLVDAMQLLDIRTLDHIIIAGTEYSSFAEEGLI